MQAEKKSFNSLIGGPLRTVSVQFCVKQTARCRALSSEDVG